MNNNLAIHNKNLFKKFLKFLWNKIIGSNREEILSKRIVKIIKKYQFKNIKILDIGSGSNVRIAKNILPKLPNLEIIDCYDFYNNKFIKHFNKNNKKINLYNIRDLNMNKKKYHFCLLIDVLHHINLKNEKKINRLIYYVLKKTKFLIVKDHLYKTFFERLLLFMMDCFGNYKDNVKTYSTYFNKKSFKDFVKKNYMNLIYYNDNINYVPKYIMFFNRNNLHFLSVLKKNDDIKQLKVTKI